MTINTNMSALTAYRNLSTTQNDMSKSLEKLSSGLRINRASDDAAGLAISEGLKSQVGGLTVAARNAQDGINVTQTAEGSLGQVQAILQRMRDLAVQAGNDSNNVDSRKAITGEATQLTQELGRISTSTNFNGINLLDGTGGTNNKLTFQVGANGSSDNQIVVDLSSANVANIANTLSGTTGTTFSLNDAGAKTFAGGAQTFTSTSSGVSTVVTTGSIAAGGATTTVADVTKSLNADAAFSSKFTASTVIDNTGAATGIKIVANDGAAVDAASFTGSGSVGAAGGGLDFSSAVGAQAAIGMIDKQITSVSSARASLGAVQNRLEYTITNLNISKENLTASQSQITDTDMASEMVNFTRDSILSQAGTAMLAQANQSTSGVLKLLQ
ncbi:MAG: flagellin [Lacisediminihabitans sp.]